jgi:glycosyltransferase involved in cell wall biosynthesis
LRELGNEGKKTLLVSDAWYPQVNGVVRTMDSVRQNLVDFGHKVSLITPDQFRSLPMPTYTDIRLATNIWPRVGRMIDEIQPDYIMLATEGPLGIAARLHCVSRKLHFSTTFNTKFPEYVNLRFRIPESWTYRFLLWFHGSADGILVATNSLRMDLIEHGFKNTQLWARGVDTEMFRPYSEPFLEEIPRPIWLNVGRVAVEKNLEAFLDLDLPGTKVIVGGGPSLNQLKRKYPEAVFAGEKHGEELVRYYSAGDVFVFPSKTDTFGLVLLEALACGTPVAAYPVTGPIDVIRDNKVGILDNDLQQAALKALSLNREYCRRYALQYSWANCIKILEEHLRSNRTKWLGVRN